MGPGAQMAVGTAVAAGHGDNILLGGKSFRQLLLHAKGKV